ncbi:MAG: hypothetical protein EOO71_18050 [Myxococcaceae bacterium]|nr:MAG: hypothetical protein EOO71_18050 [Myxococcaceae bacterium]
MRLQPVLLAVMLSACASRGPAFFASSANYGTAHPFLLMASAQDGRWLLACQARRDTDGDGQVQLSSGNHGELFGDTLRTYLFLEPGAGLPIDALLATDPTGRFLALVRDGTLLLLDLETREEKVLALKVTTDPSSPEPPVRASFSRDGRHLLFLRPEKSRSVAVVRDLREGTERVLDAGSGRIEQAVLVPSGHWAMLDMVEDSDPDPPWTQQNPMRANNAACRGPALPTSSFSHHGDTPIRRYRRVDGGPFVQGNDVLHPLGEGMLRRAPDSSIVFEDAQGRRETWVPASCNARLLHVDEARQQVLVACNTRQIMVPLELHGASVHQSLGWQTTLSTLMNHGTLSGRDGRLVSTWVESKTQPNTWLPLVIDMERRTAQPLLTEWTPVTSLGALALLSEDLSSPDGTWTRRLWLWNAETGEKRVLSESKDFGLREAGDTVLLMGKWIDLRTGRVLGEVEHAPLAIDTRGRVLRPSPTAVVDQGWPLIGPVRWEPALKAPIPAEVR